MRALTCSCVTLDLDDTLFLERDYVQSGFRAVGRWLSATHGVTGFEDAAWRLFEEGVRGTTFDHAAAACGFDASPDLIAEMVSRYRAHRPDVRLLDDAKTALTCLRADVIRLAVVTDGPLESQQAKAGAVGAPEWAHPLVFTATLPPGHTKPSPEPFRLVERATGHGGPACVYVADNPAKDFAGPKALGWRTVRVKRPGSLHEAAPSGPDVDIELLDMTGLAKALK